MLEDSLENEFFYPENLTEKTTYVAGWPWWALLIIGVGILLSTVSLFGLGLVLPLVCTVIFTFLTLQIGGNSIYASIVIIINFVFADQTVYFWSAKGGTPHGKEK